MGWRTQYHPFTTTYPSNNFGGVNYAALNKDDGSRDRFVSRFEGGKLVQFDYDVSSLPLLVRWLMNPYQRM